jgi:predicted RNase H-like HicB family nuclease
MISKFEDPKTEVAVMKQFTLEFWKDEDWYVGRLLEVPGVFSQGETIEELKKNIQDAYKMVIGSEDVSFIPPTASRIPLELAN